MSATPAFGSISNTASILNEPGIIVSCFAILLRSFLSFFVNCSATLIKDGRSGPLAFSFPLAAGVLDLRLRAYASKLILLPKTSNPNSLILNSWFFISAPNIKLKLKFLSDNLLKSLASGSISAILKS